MDKNKMLTYVLYVVLIAVLGYAVYATNGFGLMKKTSSSGKWQAVFLSNGQVYFGNASNEGSQFLTLKDIYYLQVQKPIQPKSEDQQQNKVTLVKLGAEIHGPKDEMRINRDQILFIEDLKDDGKVMQSIQKYKDEGASSTSGASESSPAAATSASSEE